MQKLLTIVVPVYKVENYINKCLDSLVLDNPSTMQEYEVIIVNDGTPDRSAEMSQEYVKRYPGTFRQIDKENGGHGSAWNVGLKEAQGKYLRFLDSDDWFCNLDRLLSDLKCCDADIVFNPFNKYFFFDNRSETINPPISPGTTDFPDTWGCSKVNFWGATYKTSILQPLFPLFAERIMFDDYILTWVPLINGRSCIALDYVVYNYLIGRPGQSMDATRQRKGANSYVKAFEQYEYIRSRFVTQDVPSYNLEQIDNAITGYASYIFAYMLYLPYKEARRRMKYLWITYIADYKQKSRLEKRYNILPFLSFFIVEHVRIRLQNR